LWASPSLANGSFGDLKIPGILCFAGVLANELENDLPWEVDVVFSKSRRNS
jgi:hypothetical protein